MPVSHAGTAPTGPYHILVKMVPDTGFSDDVIEERLRLFHDEDYKMPAGRMPLLRLNLANLAEFIRDIKANVTRFFLIGRSERI